MPGKLIDSERRALRLVDKRLTNISALLQQMTGTVQEIAWVIEDALWDDQGVGNYVLDRGISTHVDEVHALAEQSMELIAAVGSYETAGQPDDLQAALNALHNAGMLPPQEEPPAYADERKWRVQNHSHRRCRRAHRMPPPRSSPSDPTFGIADDHAADT